jgi:hypothetical protein
MITFYLVTSLINKHIHLRLQTIKAHSYELIMLSHDIYPLIMTVFFKLHRLVRWNTHKLDKHTVFTKLVMFYS